MTKKERKVNAVLFGTGIGIWAGTRVLERLAPNMSEEAYVASRAARNAARPLVLVSGIQLLFSGDEEAENKCQPQPSEANFEEV